jgi:hypothetical protein
MTEKGQRASIMPDSREPGLLRASFAVLVPPPGSVAPGELLSIHIAIENCGDTLWLTSQSVGPGVVMPAVRVFDEGGSLVTEFHGEPLLPHAIAPRECVRIRVEYKAPQQLGSYKLKIDLVDQQVCWFEQRGSEPLWIEFEVRDAKVGAADD